MEQINNIPDIDENLDEVDQETGGPRRRRRQNNDDDESWEKVRMWSTANLILLCIKFDLYFLTFTISQNVM